jgi:2-C-methyl-D-erythritol 4-phosphate cytidylyltransferase
LDRSTLVLLQTPQVFERDVLLAAHQQCAPTLDPPDDATLAVSAGIRVATFPGGHDNLAITTPDDIAVAEALLTQGGKQVR